MQDASLSASREAAVRSLRANYRPAADGTGRRTFIVAGPRVYQQVWTRDFCYAAGGALLLGDLEPVRGTLEAFLVAQREDGLFPKALSPMPPYVMTALEYAGLRLRFKPPLKPYYTSEQFVVSYDSNALLVYTAARYVAAANDADFARRHVAALSRGMDWYEARLRDGLVEQPPYSDWQDAVGRRGRVFYTNLVRWSGLCSLEALLKSAGHEEQARTREAQARLLRGAMRDFFWDKEAGLFRNADTLSMADTASNYLAIVWGFAEPGEAESILKALESPGIWRALGPRATYPDYPDSIKSPYARFAGFNDYHDRQVWSWTAAMAACAYARTGRADEARRRLEPLAAVIAREGVVGEVYEEAGQVRRWLARSESPFSWGAGMWLEACSALGVPAG